MFKELFGFAKKFAIDHPTTLTLAIPTSIIGFGIHKASPLVKATYFIACGIAGGAAGMVDGKLAVKRNQILNTETL